MRAAAAIGGLLVAAVAGGCAAPATDATDAIEASQPALTVTFRGNASRTEPELRRVIEEDLADFEQRGRRKAAMDDAAYSLELHYLGRGFPFVRVVPEYEPLPGGAVRLGFEIEEGPRTVLEAIHLHGNEHFSDVELRELFRGPTVGVLGTGSLYYVAANLEAGAAAIAALYWSAGHLKAEVDPPEVVFSADRAGAEVMLRIREGLAYRLVGIELSGPLVVPEAELRAELQGFVGQPYFPQVAYAARARLLEFYGARGHADAAASFSEARDDRTGDVSLSFRVDPGPVVTVSSVNVRGVGRTEEDFILARLKLQPGESWSTERERESFADLHRSGLFSKVSITLEPGPGEQRAVDVEVSERASRETYVEPGYGSYEGPRVTLGYRDRNVLGSGRIFHLEGSLSSKAQRALIGLTDPWFHDGISADVTLFINHRDEPSFTRRDVGAAATLTREHDARWQTQWGYTYRRSQVSNVDVVDADVQAALDDVDISAISLSPAYESRDDLFSPQRGTSMRASFEWGDGAIGSELDFFRTRFGQSWFRPLGRGGVLGFSFRTGFIIPYGSTDVIPLQERFFNGGENTVRSFIEQDLGPKDEDGNPIGGETFTVLSLELRRPIHGKLDGALFIDTGNVLEHSSDYFHFTGFASAVGGGLRYMLPIGPVRLDFGVNPAPRDDEDTWVAHLSVGMPF